MSNGEWKRLGTFGVDSGQFWIGDPMYIVETHDFDRDFNEPAQQCNDGVIGSAGLGDGGYVVEGRFVDVGKGDMRLAELRVVFITEKDIEEWNRPRGSDLGILDRGERSEGE